MAYNDKFRLSSHAVIFDADNRVLLLKANYGVYYHSAFDSQAFIFQRVLADQNLIKLSDEHSEYKFVSLSDLSAVQKTRVEDCLEYSGAVISRRF